MENREEFSFNIVTILKSLVTCTAIRWVRPVLLDIPLCCAMCVDKWREVSPMYVHGRIRSTVGIIDDTALQGVGSMVFKVEQVFN